MEFLKKLKQRKSGRFDTRRLQSLVKKGHHVLVETNAGLGSGFADEDYTKQGQPSLRLLQKLRPLRWGGQSQRTPR